MTEFVDRASLPGGRAGARSGRERAASSRTTSRDHQAAGSGLLALQRHAGNAAVGRLLAKNPPAGGPGTALPAVQRQSAAPAPAAPTTAPKQDSLAGVSMMDVEVLKKTWDTEWVTWAVILRPLVAFIEVSAGGAPSDIMVGQGNVGAVLSAVTAKFGEPHKFVTDALGTLNLSKIDFRVAAEGSVLRKVVQVSVRGTLTSSKYPTLAAVVEPTLVGVYIDAKAPKDPVFGAIEVDLRLMWSDQIHVPPLGRDVVMVVRATGEFIGIPKWSKIIAKLAGKAALAGGKTAATAVVGGKAAAAVAGGKAAAGGLAGGSALGTVASIALPAAAAGAFIYGWLDSQKTGTAMKEAVRDGQALRRWLKIMATGYARTLTGGSGKGSGAEAAEADLQRIMSVSGLSRGEAVAAVIRVKGDYARVFASTLKELNDHFFQYAVMKYEERHAGDRGWFEKVWKDEDSGDRGAYRRYLARILYEPARN